MKTYTYLEIFPDNRPNWISKLELHEEIEKRIIHCDERISFWRDKSELVQVWRGIKVELESLLRALDSGKEMEK